MAATEARDAIPIPARSSAPVDREARLAIAGAILCLAAVAMASSGAPSNQAFGRGLLELLIVGVPIAAGLYALRARVNRSFGIALLAIGLAWSLTALGESSLSVPYTIGRLATWLVFPSVYYLLLAFPDGRIAPGPDRVLFAAMVAVSVLLFFGTAPLAAAFPPHTPWATCTTDCPANAVFAFDRQPAVLAEIIRVREWLVIALWLGMFWSMRRRWRTGSTLQREAMVPVFAAATALGLCHIAFHVTRQAGAPASVVDGLGTAWLLCIVAVSATFVVGLFRRRMLVAGALARLGASLRNDSSPVEARDALGRALGDRTLELVFRDAGGWHDALGRAIREPRPAPARRAVTTIEVHDDHEVAIIHDASLRHDRELLEAVSSMLLAGWRQERLMADLSTAMADLDDSRRRIAEAADQERARIERDLHDGVQQRLVALRIRLGLAEDLLQVDAPAGLREIHDLGFEADRTVEELRSLAHGVYPSLLTDWGLVDALRAVARQAPMRVHVDALGMTRHPIEIESALYFICVEAMQNAMKHAEAATEVWIKLTQSRTALRFEIRDDGPGFARQQGDGRGLRNMRDRVEAIGGRLTIDSRVGRGTRVKGSVDVAPLAPAPAPTA
jgi:signal transduction histidine kinase